MEVGRAPLNLPEGETFGFVRWKFEVGGWRTYGTHCVDKNELGALLNLPKGETKLGGMERPAVKSFGETLEEKPHTSSLAETAQYGDKVPKNQLLSLEEATHVHASSVSPTLMVVWGA